VGQEARMEEMRNALHNFNPNDFKGETTWEN